MTIQKEVLEFDPNPLRDVPVASLKARLSEKGLSLYRWAGTTDFRFNTVYCVVQKYAGSEQSPVGMTSIRILNALHKAIL